MILVYEPVWYGSHHAPGNSVTIQTIARAFPDQMVRVLAEAGHLRELQADPSLTAYANVSFHPAPLSPWFQGKTHIVSARRFAAEFANLRAALRAVPAGEPVLLMLISVTPTAIFAAALLARAARRPIGVQVGLHGNLNEITGWRSRNPLLRSFDLAAALRAGHPGKVRYLVLEAAIRDELARLVPAAGRRTDVLPLPVNLAEVALARPVPFAPPLRIGLVGQATEAKGITPFLALAHRFQMSHPGKVAFHLVGRAMPGDDPARFAPLADPLATDFMTREEFLARLARLHFVCLPLQPGYYSLSASGALIDAITWLKPVIATPVPIAAALFREFGDLGYLCADLDTMAAAIEDILGAMDAERYARQVAAMAALRASRMPETLAQTYRAIVTQGFPGLLTAAA